MTGWQVQEMWEADAAAEWERLNAPDPFEEYMRKASVPMKMASNLIDQAENLLVSAQCELGDTPMEDVVGSLFDQLMDLRTAIEKLADNYAKGVRE